MASTIKKAIPVTLGLLLLAGSPAFAAGHYTRHHVFISSRVASSFDAIPGWAESPRPSIRNDGAPSYNDPSKFGGSEALPVQ